MLKRIFAAAFLLVLVFCVPALAGGLQIHVGATSVIGPDIFIQDSTSTTGAGKTGLVFNTSSLTCYYHRNTASASVAVTLATMTLGTFASGGFKEVDATNMPGVYSFCPPDAALASGASRVVFTFAGATGMSSVTLEIELTAFDPLDAVRGGFTALPNANAEAAGGLYTRGTGAGQINQDGNGRIDVNDVRVDGAALGTHASGQYPSDVRDLLGTAWLTPGTAGTPDVNAKLIGGTSQTGRDIGTSVLLSSGTGTGQLDFTSGIVKSNEAQILGTAISTPATAGILDVNVKKWSNGTVPSPNVTGEPLVDLNYGAGTAIPAGAIPNAVAGAAGGIFIAGTNAATTITTGLTAHIIGTVDTLTTYTGNTLQTADVAAGVNVTGWRGGTPNILQSGRVDAYQGAIAVGLHFPNGMLTDITSSVWGAARSSYTTSGTFGEGVASVIGNVAGTVASVVGDVGGNVSGNVVGSVASVVGAVGSVTGNISGTLANLASGAKTDVENSVWNAVRASHTTSGTFGQGAASVQGNVTGSVASVSGNVSGTVNGLTAAGLATLFTVDSTKVYGDAVSGSVVKEIASNAAGTSASTIAAAVWDDALPGSHASGSAGHIIGTSLPDIAAGSANGLLRAGSNAATSITTALTANIVGNVTGSLSGSVGSVSGAVGSVTGSVGSVTGSVGSLASQAQTDAATGVWAAATRTITGGTIGTYTGNTPQTGDSFARIGAAGAGITALGDARIANLDAAISSRMATFSLPTNFSTLSINSAGAVTVTGQCQQDIVVRWLATPFETDGATVTLQSGMMHIYAVLCGVSSGGGSTTLKFYSPFGVVSGHERVTTTLHNTSDFNRTAVSRNP